MTKYRLKQIQDDIKFDAPSMAACVGITIRCYYNYLYGINKIPPDVERKVMEVLQINQTFVRDAPERIDARIADEFPCGVPNIAVRRCDQ